MTDEELLQVIEQAAKKRLTKLDLSGYNLTSLPPEIAQLSNLRNLELSHNNLTALPPEITQLCNLKTLVFNGNSLRQLPPGIGELINLTELSLASNGLSMFPSEIGQLTNLTVLNLNHNRLTLLPSVIGRLTNLANLHLYRNELDVLPPEIRHLIKLTKLDLSHNHLSELPTEIGRLTNLRWLELNGNQLTALPPEISKLTKLKVLDLRDNPLPIPPEVLEKKGEPAFIIGYYLQHEIGLKRSLNRAKMLLVPQESTSKTSSPSPPGNTIQYYSCFISFSSKDEAFARRLHADLQQQGVRCWFAPEDMKIGARIRPTIDQSIRLHDKLLLVLSEHSINSDWVEKEVETAFEEERKRNQIVLFPVRLDEAAMETDLAWAADIRRTRHIGDFSLWQDHDAYQRAFERLLRDLKAEG
jgi:hypothetical protein